MPRWQNKGRARRRVCLCKRALRGAARCAPLSGFAPLRRGLSFAVPLSRLYAQVVRPGLFLSRRQVLEAEDELDELPAAVGVRVKVTRMKLACTGVPLVAGALAPATLVETV